MTPMKLNHHTRVSILVIVVAAGQKVARRPHSLHREAVILQTESGTGSSRMTESRDNVTT